MSTNETIKNDLPAVSKEGLSPQIQMLLEKDPTASFVVLVLQLANIETFIKRRPPAVVAALFHEVGAALRRAIHPSQYVGRYQAGFAITLQQVNVGQLDVISKRLSELMMHTIRRGKYNDFRSHWTDIIHEFLHPNSPGVLFPRIGWAIHPRDGSTPMALVNRALFHLKELAR